MNKKNLPLILGGVVFLLAAAGLGYLAFAQFTRFDEGSERMEAANAKLAKLVNRKPFPSAANVKALEEQTENFGAYLQELTARMREGQIVPAALNFSQFSGAFEETRTRLAAIAGEHGVQIPPQFDYGFKYYADGNMPLPDDMDRLVRQLSTVEMLSTVLYEAGIQSIVSVERPIFEAAALAAAQNKGDEGRRRRRGDDEENASTNAAASTEYADPDGLFTREHYVVKFTASDEALLKALAAFSENKPVTVVTKVSVENKARPQPPANPAAGAAGDGTGQDPAEPLPRELRVIAGKETPAVAFELDVYRFPEPAGAEDGSENAEERR